MGSQSVVTTAIGFKNRKGQVVVRNTGHRGVDLSQYIYQLACGKCGHNYGANGSDIYERKCPACQDGEPGFVL
jgi:PHP family Zn ribbon phosphoesterase